MPLPQFRRGRTLLPARCPNQEVVRQADVRRLPEAAGIWQGKVLPARWMHQKAGLKGKRWQFRPFSAKHLRGVISAIRYHHTRSPDLRSNCPPS